MPGIFGYYDVDNRLPNSTLSKMAESLRVNATDQFSIEFFPVGGIGIVNLAGHPLIEGGGRARYAILGALDDFIGGVGVISHDQIAHRCFGGDKVVEIDRVRGNFSAVVLGRSKESLTLVTDRFASYPLYVCNHENVWYFASQVKAILAVLPRFPGIDNESLATMLTIGEVVGNRTLVSGISTIPASSIISFSKNEVDRLQYWHYVYEQDLRRNWDDSVDQVGLALKSAVSRSLRDIKSPAVPLSGGLDSRFALDLTCQLERKPSAYTWGILGCRDILYAQDVSRRLGCEHETFIFDDSYLSSFAERGVWLTEGHTPVTNFHVLPYVDILASNEHDLLIDGFAGDGVLGGNFISNVWLESRDFSATASSLWLWRRNGFDGGLLHHHSLTELQELGRLVFEDSYLGYGGQTPMDSVMAFLIDNRVRRVTTCGTEIFRSRIPVRQPFMDADFMDVVRTLPHSWRKRHKFYISVLNKFAPVSSASPYQRTMLPPTVPHWMNVASLAAQWFSFKLTSKLGLPDLLTRRSPSDFSNWFRGALRPFVEQTLLNEKTLDRGLIPADAVVSVVRQHMNCERDLSSLIGSMLSIEFFCRIFVDDLMGGIRRHSYNSSSKMNDF